MSQEEFTLFIFFPLAFVIVIWIGYSVLTKKGRGRLYGGEIEKEFDGVSSKRKIFSSTVKVYAVKAPGNLRRVGIDIKSSSFASYQMIPVSFTASEARQLAEMLIEAADYTESKNS